MSQPRSQTTTQTASPHQGHDAVMGHAVPAKVLIGTWLSLMALTAVTVLVARVNLGQLNVVAALGIATVKASLVAAFFMHLRYEGRFNLVVLLGALFFVLFMVTYIVLDARAYQPSIRSFEADHPTPGVIEPAGGTAAPGH